MYRMLWQTKELSQSRLNGEWLVSVTTVLVAHLYFLTLVFRWSLYKVNPRTDRISVFVSIVSTKIPFKGTSKEYIGDDKDVLHDCIKKAITNCCLQLKRRIASQQAARTKADRKKQMAKYIPDVARSLMSVLNAMTNPDGAGPSILNGKMTIEEAEAIQTKLQTAKRKRGDGEDDDEGLQRYHEMVEKLRIRPEEKRSDFTYVIMNVTPMSLIDFL